LDYAGQESVEWARLARALAVVLAVYSVLRLLANAVQVSSYFRLFGVSPAMMLTYAVDPMFSGLALIVVLILSWQLARTGRGRGSLVWALLVYMGLRLLITLVLVVAAVFSLRSVAPAPNVSFSMWMQAARVLVTVSECVLPAAAVWLLTRPQMRRRS
jgi:hypothetical protein